MCKIDNTLLLNSLYYWQTNCFSNNSISTNQKNNNLSTQQKPQQG
jgi:hypothetical protein